MRPLALALLAALALSSPVRAEWRLHLGPEAYHSTLFRGKDVGVRGRGILEYQAWRMWAFFLEYSSYKVAIGSEDLKGSAASYGIAYNGLAEGRLFLGVSLNSTSFEYGKYDGGAGGYGARVRYHFPLGGGGWRITPYFGFDYTKPFTLTWDTGVPVTENPFSNMFCELFTFGIADGCGTVREHLSFPASSAYSLGVALGYEF